MLSTLQVPRSCKLPSAWNVLRILLPAFLFGAPVLPGFAASAEGLIADMLDFGDARSEKAHALTTRGQVESAEIETEMGGFKRSYQATTVAGTGSQVQFTLTRRRPSAALIMEVQEIHARRPQSFGYVVAVNGVGVYVRTYEELGAGPNHYFIKLPDISGNDPVVVTITSMGTPPFSLGKLWLYEDFFSTIEPQEKVYRPLCLLGNAGTAPGGGGPGRDFAPFGDYLEVKFLNRPAETVRRSLEQALTHSAETERPVEILINGPTWGGAPKGPDGRGGYLTDTQYSQIYYNKTHNRWAPLYPNMWSNSFWTTFQSPYLNDIIRQRFLAGLSEVTRTVDFLKAHGLQPRPVYVRELGPDLGQITAGTIAAAAEEGITLDPADGLDQAERQWLHRNDIRLWEKYAAAHAEVFPPASVIVDRGQIHLPDEQPIDNQYAHTAFKTAQGPLKDRRHFGGQTGMVEGFWSSGEVHFEEYPLYDYVKANGKLGHVNIWAPFANEPSTLRSLYDAGFQFAAFIGDTAETAKVIRAADGCADLPAILPPHNLPCFLEVMYNAHRTMGPPENIVAADNLKIHEQGGMSIDAGRMAIIDTGNPGQITYRIDNGGAPFPGGLSLELDGRIAPGEDNTIKVMVGENPNGLRQAAVITAKELPSPDHWTLHMTSKATIDLGEQLKGRNIGHVRLEFNAQGAPDAAFLMQMKITGQWPRATGHSAGNPFSMRQQRTLNLWIQDRVVAERLVTRYLQLAGQDATYNQAHQLLNEGRYRTVQRLLSGALSEILPARYVVRGHGRLGRHDISLSLPGEDDVLVVTLHALTADSCEFSVVSEREGQPFVVNMPSANGAHWNLAEIAPDRFRLAQAQDGTLLAQDGRVAAAAEARQPAQASQKLPATLVARYLRGNKHTITVDTQELELMKGGESMTLPVANGATVTRAPERLDDGSSKAWPQEYDRLELALDERGRVIAMHATYGHDAGCIAKYTPLSVMPPFTNGTITLDNGNTYEFSFSTKVDTVALHGAACAYESHMLMDALRPGMSVSIDYSPYTEQGTSRRLIAVSQPHRVLWSQDFTKMTGNEWRDVALEADGVVVKMHDTEPYGCKSPENPKMLMRPAQPFVPGAVVYRVATERPLGFTVLEFNARVFDDASRIDFAASVDGGTTWTTCGRFDNTWQNCFAQGVKTWDIPWNYVDLTTAVEGRTEFLLKLTMQAHSADDRMALGGLRVVTDAASE